MDIFDSRNFKINKSMLICMGQWPFLSTRVQCIGLAVMFILAGTNLCAKICATISSRNDIETVKEDLTPLMADVMAVLKLYNSVTKIDQMKDLLTRVQRDYAVLTSEDELRVMNDYAHNGRTFTIIYSGIFFVTIMLFMIPPLMPILANNGTDRPFVHHVEYFVDPWEYYYPIIIQSYVTISIVVYTIVTMDTLLVILVQHVCGLYTTIGHRIRDIASNDENLIDFYPTKQDDESFKNISICIRRHQEAIEFSNILDSYYSTTFFLQAAVNVGGLSISGSQALTTHDTTNFFQHCSVVWSAFAHIFFECMNGQRLIDHSSRIHEYLIEAKWYETSMRTTKIMNLMIARSRYPCVLTAAGMLVMSMDTFSAVLRTSMSYFTVMRSTQ